VNPFKGAGVVLLLALVAVLLSGVSNTSYLFLGLSAVIIFVSLITYTASVRRRRRDCRAAGC
jgi:hypothetical protein